MTRLRSDAIDTPLPMMADFYGQRASEGGFLIAESAAISISGRSYFGAPGIYLPEHVTGWKAVTGAVHAKGGRIFLQVFHGGRQSHKDITGGSMPVAPSVVPFKGMAKTPQGFVDSGPFRALEIGEIPGILADFRHAAQLALEAGFDGVDGPEAEEIVDRGDADFVAFAWWFSSNPDLPERLRHGWPLAPYKREAFWGGDEHGYSDFTPYQQVAALPEHDSALLAAAAWKACSVACGALRVRCRVRSQKGAAHVSHRRVHVLWWT
jgi:2,4-dienoyl-CoA reductase-like NADH-dependent reductase (Old Yellow Enzyme family)